MFLSKIYDYDQKVAFIKLAALVALADDSGMNSNDDQARRLGIDFVDENEMEMLLMFAREMDLSSLGASGTAYNVALAALAASRSESGNVKDNVSRLLKDVVNQLSVSSDEVIKKYSSDGELKKQIMLKLIDRDVDITAINQEVILGEMKKHPKPRKEIFEKVISTILEEVSFSRDLKKIIIFELIGIACTDENYSEIEGNVISTVANVFNIDSETIEELKEIVMKFNELSKEAAELITE